MSKIFIIGATGYIGRPIAQALLRSGNYSVYGLARTPAKAAQLAAVEIIPVEGSAKESSGYLSLIRDTHIDMVIMCGADEEAATILADLKKAGQERLETAKKAGIASPKLGVIYISGTWVHGSSHDPVNDLDIVGNDLAKNPPAELVAWRAAFERDVLAASDVLDIVIARPGLVYGGSGDIWTIFFAPLLAAVKNKKEEAEVQVDEDSLVGLIHVDDVAGGIHALVDKLPLLIGTGVHPVFDFQTTVESLTSILKAAAKHIGFNGKVEFTGAGDDTFAKAMNTSVNSNCGRARTLLGWEPKRIGMLNRMDIYAKAWLAAQNS